jgi:hypothetical protein
MVFVIAIIIILGLRSKLPLTFLGLAKVGFREHQSSNLVQKLIEISNVQPSTKAPLLPNPC